MADQDGRVVLVGGPGYLPGKLQEPEDQQSLLVAEVEGGDVGRPGQRPVVPAQDRPGPAGRVDDISATGLLESGDGRREIAPGDADDALHVALEIIEDH